uniref:Uncharacterized protein n=1 Tax=Phytophthora ramorum TaxID=164328 RepID=H3GVZ6_PHYRM
MALALAASTLDFHPKLRLAAPTAVSNDSEHSQQLLQHRALPTVTSSGRKGQQAELRNSTSVNTSEQVTPDDLFHLSFLHGACIAHKNAIVPWQFGALGPNQDDEEHNLATLIHENDPDLLLKRRKCPDVDLFLSSGALTKEMYDGLKNVPGMVAYFSSKDTVDHLPNGIDIDQRKSMGESARRQYHKDTKKRQS